LGIQRGVGPENRFRAPGKQGIARVFEGEKRRYRALRKSAKMLDTVIFFV
jgi:hypothetical protein